MSVKVCPKCKGQLNPVRLTKNWVLRCNKCFLLYGSYANKSKAEKEKKYADPHL